MTKDSTNRFGNRVEDYVKYRPDYPGGIVDFLKSNYELTLDKQIADIGAGTGISAALFLEAGYAVTAVEPNTEMRNKSIELLGAKNGFRAIDGTAENTNLESGSIDGIVAGQAYHWFDVAKAKIELKRILKPGGIVILIWNERKTNSDFEIAYDQFIIKHAIDYVQVDHRNIDTASIVAFFDPLPVHLEIFVNQQIFDFDGLKGRLLSSSYMPALNEIGYDAMIEDLKLLFAKYQKENLIAINYDTKLYVGQLIRNAFGNG